MLPHYIAKSIPNPPDKRRPWYANTAPSYAGVWLWVVFYQLIAEGTLDQAGLAWSLAGLVVAAFVCYALFYFVPGMLGMKTGYPLSVVGTSTFGTSGGYLIPGLLMGLLQVGWVAVNTAVSAGFILRGLHMSSSPGKTPADNLPFTAIAILWCLLMTFIGVKGIQYVARVSLYVNAVAFLMVAFVFSKTHSGISHYLPPANGVPLLGVTAMMQMVIGFFATAGAAGADFGMNSRDARDVKWGGLVGITLAAIYAGGLPLLSVAGARGLHPSSTVMAYSDAIALTGGVLSSAMFFLFAIASVVPACVSAFIASNTFSTIVPKLPRIATALVGAAVIILLAITGLAGNLVNVFLIVGASFGPICGAMTADYLLSGKRWAGPRRGVNYAGYIAWALGFVVGIVPFLPLSGTVKNYTQPQVLWSWITGFVAYVILAKAGVQPESMPLERLDVYEVILADGPRS